MLVALMDGRALTATELANSAGVTRQTASAHLSRLRDEHLVRCERQGRHAYFALHSERVASLLEHLMGVSVQSSCKPVRTGPASEALRRARVCYDHLAGELAVGLFDSFQRKGFLDVERADDSPQVRLTEAGRAELSALGLALESLAHSRRPACRACLDWSARRYHLAGGFGLIVLQHVLEKGWARRVPDSRVVEFSARGERAFHRSFLSN